MKHSVVDAQIDPERQGGQKTTGRVALLVLGMHRSGTSALARVLNLLGCALPRTQMGANASQETGHWESEAVRAFNDGILESIGSEWCDWQPIHDGWYRSPAYADSVASGRAVMREEFGAAPLVVLKDPRICRMVRLWRDILAGEGVRPAFVMPLRNPLEVADSLKQRDGIDPSIGMLMWLRHVLDAEIATRGDRRVVCSYEALLDNWAVVVARIGSGLGLTWSRQSVVVQQEVEQFLRRDLRHSIHRAEAVTDNPLLSAWVRETYSILMGWDARGEDAGDYPVLDRIRCAFDEAGPAFARPLLAVRTEQRRADGLVRQWEENRNYLEGRIAELQYDLAQAEDKGALEKSQEERAALERECASLRGELEQARGMQAELEAARAWAEDVTRQAEEKVATAQIVAAQGREVAEQALQVAEHQRFEAEAQVAREVARAESEAARHEEALRHAGALAQRVAELESAIIQRQEESAQAWAELAEARSALADYEAEREAQDAALAERDAAMARIGEKLADSEGWVFRLAAERHAGQLAVRQAQGRLEQSEKARKDAERRLEELECALSLARRDLARAKDGLASAPVAVVDHAPALAELRRELRATQAGRQESEGLVDRLHAEVATLTGLLSEAQAQAVDAQKCVVTLETRMGDMETRAQTAEQKVREAEVRHGHLEAQLAERFGEIAAMTSTLRAREADGQSGSARADWLRAVSAALIERPSWWAILPAFWQERRQLRLLRQRGLFDPQAYLQRYPDVAQSGMKPLRHFILHGLAEGRLGQP